MSSPRRPIMLALLAVVVLTAAGCETTRILGPRTWTAAAESANGRTFVVNVRDTSGRIDSVEIDPAGADPFGEITNPPGQPNVLLVPWTGGSCDEQTDIEIAANGAGLSISLSTRSTAGACDAMGVGHLLRITGTSPLPAAAVTFRTMPAGS